MYKIVRLRTMILKSLNIFFLADTRDLLDVQWHCKKKCKTTLSYFSYIVILHLYYTGMIITLALYCKETFCIQGLSDTSLDIGIISGLVRRAVSL